ncbi:MAG: hypothetical protein IJ193_01945 [Bacilli bacterium]|nr:hypothetical protein [Bacilli bacterium]
MKYYDGVCGGYNGFVILMREECFVHHYSPEPELTKEMYSSCELKKGAELDCGAGTIHVADVKQDEEDIQVTFDYIDNRDQPKKAYVSLGQEVMIRLLEDDHNSYNYVVSHCHLMIATKEYAKDYVTNGYKVIENPKHYSK